MQRGYLRVLRDELRRTAHARLHQGDRQGLEKAQHHHTSGTHVRAQGPRRRYDQLLCPVQEH